jgi:riboflavin synthase
MFTGIIEETGEIRSFTKQLNGAIVEVACQKVLEDTKVGDSIAINGVCETVVSLSDKSFTAKISDETLAVTTFKSLKAGDRVNLERALTLNSRLGGHIVSGHVDCTGRLFGVERLADFCNLEFEVPQEQEKYLVYKGSVTVNGISLTVAQVNGNVFKVAVIPHTYENTNLKSLSVGDSVNIETDILGKYVEKMLSVRDNKRDISLEFLQENGFV